MHEAYDAQLENGMAYLFIPVPLTQPDRERLVTLLSLVFTAQSLSEKENSISGRIEQDLNCSHEAMLLVHQTRRVDSDGTYRDRVEVCPNCGMFRVWVRQNGENVVCEFVLSSAEMVTAAGQYLNRAEEGVIDG